MTFSQAVAEVAAWLAAAGLERARSEAELIVAAAAGRPREHLLLCPEAPLSQPERDRALALAARRAAREPLAYVLGRAEFYSLDFAVGPAAIVPRPETEVLVEAVAERARAIGASLAVDVGTGCGVVAVALARELPGMRVVAVDVSLEAARLAARNAARLGVAERVHVVCGDLLGPVGPPVDCVAANLPYVRAGEFAGLDPEVSCWEPRAALDGGRDGLEVIRRLVVQLPAHLASGGFAALEVGAGQGEKVANALIRAGLVRVEMIPDYAGVARVVIGWREE